MKKILTLIIINSFLCALVSCTKNDGNNNSQGGGTGSDQNSSPLVPESTGWKRIAMVKNSGKYIDQLVPCRMTGYDLFVSGNKLQVLYSEDKFENGDMFSAYMKASVNAGDATDAAVTEIKNFPSFIRNPDEFSFRLQFRPGTFNMETLRFSHSYTNTYDRVELFDELTNSLTIANPFFDASKSIRMLASGDLLAGDVNYQGQCELDYYNRASNSWKYINQSSGDQQFAIAYTPFRLDDGSMLAFRLYSKTGRSYLSIADFVYNAVYPAAPYSARFTEEHAEYAPSGVAVNGITPLYAGSVTTGAYTTEGNSVTIVMTYQDKTTGAYTLSAYKWTAGNVSFQKLYNDVPVSAALGGMMVKHRDEVGCLTDGTVYALIKDDHTYRLSLTNAGGEKSYAQAGDNNTGSYVATMNCLRYLNGAYYAVVTPFFSGKDFTGQHLDIVKFTP